MAFDENKVMWTTEEILAAVAADRVYEMIDAYLEANPGFSTRTIIGILTNLAKDHVADMVKIVKFLFSKDKGTKGFLDSAKDILCMLERDNNWIA